MLATPTKQQLLLVLITTTNLVPPSASPRTTGADAASTSATIAGLSPSKARAQAGRPAEHSRPQWPTGLDLERVVHFV